MSATTGMVDGPRMVPPARSLEQQMSALAFANEIRSYRAGIKRDITAGLRSAAGVLLSADEKLATMKVLDVLLAAPKVGRVRALHALNRAGVSPSKTLGGLTSRQRSALLDAWPSIRGG